MKTNFSAYVSQPKMCRLINLTFNPTVTMKTLSKPLTSITSSQSFDPPPPSPHLSATSNIGLLIEFDNKYKAQISRIAQTRLQDYDIEK